MKTIVVEYTPADRVLIDREITGHVTEVSVLPGPRILYQVSWMHNGDSRKDYFDGFRLEAAP
jgi:hypothetical protein